MSDNAKARFSVTMDQGIARRLDEYASEQGIARSSAIEAMVRQALNPDETDAQGHDDEAILNRIDQAQYDLAAAIYAVLASIVYMVPGIPYAVRGEESFYDAIDGMNSTERADFFADVGERMSYNGGCFADALSRAAKPRTELIAHPLDFDAAGFDNRDDYVENYAVLGAESMKLSKLRRLAKQRERRAEPCE